MRKIATLADLEPYLDFNPEYLAKLFLGNTTELGKVRRAAEAIMDRGSGADLPVVLGEGWKIVLNIQPVAGETRPEAHRDWHDVSLYLTGGNDIKVGKGMIGAAEKEKGGGEWRGGEITEVRTVSLRSGDLLLVPAGVPHENALQPRTAFLVLKANKGAERLSPVADVIENWSDISHRKAYAGNGD